MPGNHIRPPTPLFLFGRTHRFHLFVRIICVQPAARATGPVRHHHSAKPFIRFAETFRYRRISHKFDVVFMSRYGQMRCPSNPFYSFLPSGRRDRHNSRPFSFFCLLHFHFSIQSQLCRKQSAQLPSNGYLSKMRRLVFHTNRRRTATYL